MNITIFKRIFPALLLMVFFSIGVLSAQTGVDSEEDLLVIKVAVIGPGDELYFWWGHIGLIIEDYEAGRARFYDWGIFSFENENFFANFAFGRLLYTCGVSSPEWNLRNYTATNRDITLYTLNLPPEKKQEIRQYAEWTVLPENRDYYYHHFRDNCATRLRDIIDMGTGGQFKARYENEVSRFTLRQQIRRHTWFNPFFDWFLNFLMGQGIDTPISVWDDMFLPSEIGGRVREFTYTYSGAERQLFQSEEIKNQSIGRPAVLDAPRSLWPGTLALGCAIALVMAVFLVLKYREIAAGHFLWALGQGIWGLFLGAAGSILFFMTFFTNHDYTYRNINVLYANPLLLTVLPLGILYCAGISSQRYYRWEWIIKSIWSCVFVLGIISILINAVFWGQQNQADYALILPGAAVLSWLPDLAFYIRREYLWRWLN